MKTRDVLVKARDRIVSGWCRGTSALDARGIAVAAMSKTACRWCMSGALIAADDDGSGLRALLAAIEAPSHVTAVWPWNDYSDRTQDQVIAAFDRAIAACEGP